MDLLKKFMSIRVHSVTLCSGLQTEDYVVQPIVDVSPPKWHLGHTTWFFETFVLIPHHKNYKLFNSHYNFVFNSYYETVGARVIRTDRGNLSRPTVDEIYAYRAYVNSAVIDFLKDTKITQELKKILDLGLNHEQQHQELLLSDIKYILGHNPLFPPIDIQLSEKEIENKNTLVTIPEGVYEIGFKGDGFCFDNELNRHKTYLQSYRIQTNVVTNKEYLEFIMDDGYSKFKYWHADGWEWINKNNVKAPLYWYFLNGKWMNYKFQGLVEINPNHAVCHVSFYEASAFAEWKGMRLPTEAEWEIASTQYNWGLRWEWTNSAYLPYPGFHKPPGAIGEYNGKFMVNQHVLRGASVATPNNHSRKTYRNFYHPHLRWMFSGIRLAK